MIELYGDATGNALRVAIALEESGLLYRPRKIDLRRGEHQGEDYRRLNPIGRIPTIIDSQGPDARPMVLTQSNAILLYIAEKSGKLLPPNGEPRARALEWLFLFVTDVIAPSHLGFHLKRALGADADKSAQRWLDERAVSLYGHIDRRLEDLAFLGGRSFSLADIVAYPITVALSDQLRWEALPNLRRWFDSVRTRPTVIRGHQLTPARSCCRAAPGGVHLSPALHRLDDGPQALTQSCQRVFHLGRNLRIDLAVHHPVGLEFPQLLGQHLVSRGRDQPMQLGESLGSLQEVEQDRHLPASTDDGDGPVRRAFGSESAHRYQKGMYCTILCILP